MRSILRFLAAFLVFGALASVAAHAALPIQHWTTSNGARVYFVRADTIPMLDVSLDFDAGSRFDPAGREGLASLVNSMPSPESEPFRILDQKGDPLLEGMSEEVQSSYPTQT